MTRSLGVYCASSPKTPEPYRELARELGQYLAEQKIDLVYGAGSTGLMGEVANAALAGNGHVIGVIPEFMKSREWDHSEVRELYVVEDLYQRKQLMMGKSSAFAALPGGSGTLEELAECLSWRRLDLHQKPIFIANLDGFYDDLLRQLERMRRESFWQGPDLYEVASSAAELKELVGRAFG